MIWLAIFLLTAELAVRYFQIAVPPPEDSGFLRDDDAGFVLKPTAPGEVLTDVTWFVNSAGFRDRERTVDKPAGTYRVLAIGDSHVTGDVPLDQNFLRRAEQWAQAGSSATAAADTAAPVDTSAPSNTTAPADDRNVEMVLMGCPGWQTANEVGALRGKGLPMDPDLVVLCFCIGTDITGLAAPAEVIQGNLHHTGDPNPVLNVLGKSRLFVLAQQVYLWRVMKVLRGLVPSRGGDAAGNASPRWAADAADNTQISREYARVVRQQLPVLETAPPPWLTERWEQALADLTEFDTVCRTAQVPWLLLLIPAEVQVDDAVRGEVLRYLGQDNVRLDLDGPQQRLHAWAAEHGVPVLDPTEPLRRACAAGHHQYVSNNPHWNVAGSELVGGLLGVWIAGQVNPDQASAESAK